MRKLKTYEPEGIKVPEYPKIEGWNEDIVETAGFIPLEVRFKQMEQAGYRARFFESEFTSKDVQDMYLNHPEFDITDEDDMEDAMEKLMLRQAYVESVKMEVRKRAEIEAQKQEKAERAAEKTDLKNGAEAPEEKK